MSVKKYLDYAGLQRYDDNWKLKFQEMIISDDEMEDMLLDVLDVVPDIPETWTTSTNGTLDLSLSNAYSYWPEGAGTKTVSITNGTTSGLSKFFLKLTDAGNFPMQWGNNIQWKNGSEPVWQAFNEDIIYFRSNDNGNTWIGQVLETNAIEEYWKITVQVSDNTELYSLFTNDCNVDWGDGNSGETIISYSNYKKHIYSTAGTYQIKFHSNNFSNSYIEAYLSEADMPYDSERIETYAISIDSPIPCLKGSTQWLEHSEVFDDIDNVFDFVFCNYVNIISIPDKLFYNNPHISSFYGCFWNCYSLATIPSNLFDKNTAITPTTTVPDQYRDSCGFSCCFNSCTSITSIPSELFAKNTTVTDFSYCFSDCSSLTSIPSGLFDNNTAVTNFSYCFEGCTSLQSIPSGLFDSNTAVTSFRWCFSSCSSIQSIPSGLFDNNTAVTYFDSCFRSCTSLQSIPSGLFDNNTAATYFDDCFQNCTSLQSIPSGLFNKNTAATNFSYCFSDCSSLKNFRLCIGSSSVTSFSNFISDASNVNRIICVPAGSTTYTTLNNYANASNGITVSTNSSDCFVFEFTVDTEAATAGAKKTGVPFNLYGQNGITLTVDWGDGTASTLTSANYTDSIKTPASVHEYANAGEYTVTVASNDWENTYFYATSNIFNNESSSYDYNGGTRYFQETLISVDYALPKVKGTMLGNTLIFGLAIAGGLPSETIEYLSSINYNYFDFDYSSPSIAIDNVICCFFNCINLSSIPSELFDKNTTATNFGLCFENCSSLASIPSGLFDNNTAVTNFSGCFFDCTSLQSIPSGLFDSNTAATNFWSCFSGCSSLQSIPSGLFDSNMAVTTFYCCFFDCSSLQSIPSGLFNNNVTASDFSCCFENCSSLVSIPSGLFDNNTAVTSFGNCFENCTSLQSIPLGLFDNNVIVTDFQRCFNSCSSLQSIPSGLFDKNTAVTNFQRCFQNCSSLTDFTLHIGSLSVSNCTYFVTNKSGTTRTIYVPAGSTTQTTFNAQASNLGLTIIGE